MKRIFCMVLALLLLLCTACSSTPVSQDKPITSGNISSEMKGSADQNGQATTADNKSSESSQNPSQGSATTSSTSGGNSMTTYDNDYFRLGEGLTNTYLKLKANQKLTVAFMGGSVTYGTGCGDRQTQSFRVLVINWLKQQFPGAQIAEVNAAYPSACSAYGAYCVDEKVIAHGADLVFIEYAINDYYAKSRYSASSLKAHYETIVRKLRTANPRCDIVALYTTDKAQDMSQKLFSHAAAQESVAKHYGIPSINMGWQLRTQLKLVSASGVASKWSTYFSDSVHANANGNRVYADIIIECLQKAFTAAEASNAAAIVNHTIPSAQNSGLLMNTDYVAADELTVPSKWSLLPSPYYPRLVTTTPGAELSYTFTGTGISLFIDASGITLEHAVDGGDWSSQKVTGYYHLPLPMVEGLPYGEHTITIKAPAETSGTKSFTVMAILVRK